MSKGPVILVAEDEALIAWALEQELRDAGAEVVGPCATLRECLATLAAAEIDAAILDVDLRGEQVFPAAAELQARGVPFVFHTGRADQARLETEFPGTPVFPKPTPLRDMVEKLCDILRPRQSYGASAASDSASA